MGCDCCKEVNPADYEKCQQDRDRQPFIPRGTMVGR